MNNLIGLTLFVLSSVVAGAILGGLCGLFSTVINNMILGPYFGAALGSYRWWILFHVQLWAFILGLVSLCLGLFLIYKGTSPVS